MSDLVHETGNTGRVRWLLKEAVWDKNEEDIKLLVESRPKIQNRYSDKKTSWIISKH